MQTRRPILPLLPIPRRRSSLLSLNSASSPHTPRSSGCFDACPPPVCYAASRKSTDSWNSSNADDMDFDWKPDQILLLTRTLDALPAHLVTPFNGPIPPSNLLDKIARGVAHAKGPADWPHSIRATRVKLLELARSRAKEDALAEKRRHIIQEEDAVEIEDGSASNYSYTHDGADKPLRGVGIGPRRPLYRQSSMDFIKPGAADLKDNPNIARLSNRLQRTDRTLPTPTFHPYMRTPRARGGSDENRRSVSPPNLHDVPSLMSPSTPSSTTLNSLSSLSSAPLTLGTSLARGLRPRALRRSASTLSSGSLFSSSASSAAGGVALDPRLQRVRRSDPFAAGVPPPPPPKDYAGLSGVKRAPSYGALAQDARAQADSAPPKERHVRQLSAGSYPSSDEEEKARTKRAKKMRVRRGVEVDAGSPPSSVPPSPSVAGSPAVSPRVTRATKERDAGMSPKARRVAKPYLYSQPMVVDEGEAKEQLEGNEKAETKMKAEGKEKKVEAKEKEKSKPTHRASASRDKGATRDMENAPPRDKDKAAPVSPTAARPAVRAPRMSLQRNPSMFGAELPPAPPTITAAPLRLRTPLLARAPVLAQALAAATTTAHHTPPLASPASPTAGRGAALSPAGASPGPGAPMSPATPPLSPDGASPRVKTLRRVRRLPGARRISFGSLAEEEDGAGGAGGGALALGGGLEEGFGGARRAREGRERGLGSAFQMG